jgi:hypothetical protein
MFGFVAPDMGALSRPDRARFRAVYCGLCQALSQRAGFAGRMTLTYDLTFLILLRSALSIEAEEVSRRIACPRDPLRGVPCVTLPVTDYAADVNLALAWFKAQDDRRDDGSVRAGRLVRRLEPALAGVRARRPGMVAAIEADLQALAALEAAGETNPDRPAAVFGHALAGIFAGEAEAEARPLALLGDALGRFIYLMDAAIDLKSDLRRGRYNPLIGQRARDALPALTALLGAAAEALEGLPIRRDADILHNILYAGVWRRWPKQWTKEAQH